jgi:hypothetical protein
LILVRAKTFQPQYKNNKPKKQMTSIKTNFICATLFILVAAMFSLVALAQTNSEAKPPESQVEKIFGLNTRFIVALISDGNDGAWIGTEDEGVFHWQADGKVSQFTTKNGLGDNNGYALAIDTRGRLWVGHLNTGVSVFNLHFPKKSRFINCVKISLIFMISKRQAIDCLLESKNENFFNFFGKNARFDLVPLIANSLYYGFVVFYF